MPVPLIERAGGEAPTSRSSGSQSDGAFSGVRDAAGDVAGGLAATQLALWQGPGELVTGLPAPQDIELPGGGSSESSGVDAPDTPAADVGSVTRRRRGDPLAGARGPTGAGGPANFSDETRTMSERLLPIAALVLLGLGMASMVGGS